MKPEIHFQIVAAGCMGLLLGCQTDAIVGRGPVPHAPVTSFQSVEIARQSDMSLAEKGEVDLVEQLIYHRTLYAQTLEALQKYYNEHGLGEKYVWASNELADVNNRVRPYHYLLDSELPQLTLTPRDRIPEADALYDKALTVARDGGHGIPGIYNREKISEALRMLKQLIREYPTSDKIDDAAFYCGEFHKEYFKGEESIAVKWYERAWTWDPATQHPVRFQAAVVYDYRLHDRAKALELYNAAIAAEPNKSNVRWAVDRKKQLTEMGPVESERTTPVAEPTSPAQQEPPQGD